MINKRNIIAALQRKQYIYAAAVRLDGERGQFATGCNSLLLDLEQSQGPAGIKNIGDGGWLRIDDKDPIHRSIAVTPCRGRLSPAYNMDGYYRLALGVISRIRGAKAYVYTAPDVLTECYISQHMRTLLFSGQLITVRIDENDQTRGSIVEYSTVDTNWQPAIAKQVSGRCSQRLPQQFDESEFYLGHQRMDQIRRITGEYNYQDIYHCIQADYESARRAHRIIRESDNSYSFLTSLKVKGDLEDTPMYIGFRKNQGAGSKWYVNFAGSRGNYGSVMLQDLYSSDWERDICRLAAACGGTGWDSHQLMRYLEHTYYCSICSPDAVCYCHDIRGDVAIINTGLHDASGRDIYAYMEVVVPSSDSPYKYRLIGFGPEVDSLSNINYPAYVFNNSDFGVCDSILYDAAQLVMRYSDIVVPSLLAGNCQLDDIRIALLRKAAGEGRSQQVRAYLHSSCSTLTALSDMLTCAIERSVDAYRRGVYQHAVVYNTARNRLEIMIPIIMDDTEFASVNIVAVISKTMDGLAEISQLLSREYAMDKASLIATAIPEWLGTTDTQQCIEDLCTRRKGA